MQYNKNDKLAEWLQERAGIDFADTQFIVLYGNRCNEVSRNIAESITNKYTCVAPYNVVDLFLFLKRFEGTVLVVEDLHIIAGMDGNTIDRLLYELRFLGLRLDATIIVTTKEHRNGTTSYSNTFEHLATVLLHIKHSKVFIKTSRYASYTDEPYILMEDDNLTT